MTQKNTWSQYCLKNLIILSEEIPKPRALLVQSTSSKQYFITRSVVTRHDCWIVGRAEVMGHVSSCFSWTVLPLRSLPMPNQSRWKRRWNKISKLKVIGLVRALLYLKYGFETKLGYIFMSGEPVHFLNVLEKKTLLPSRKKQPVASLAEFRKTLL